MSPLVEVAAYSAMWAGFGISSGWVASRLPERYVDHDSWLTRLRPFEERGRWYDRRLRVRWWKDRLPEAGALFGGVAKDRLVSFDAAALDGFVGETRRAELVHWANVAFGFTFVAWTEPTVAIVMAVFGVVVHTPFVVVQRYNRARLVHVVAEQSARTQRARRRAVPVRASD